MAEKSRVIVVKAKGQFKVYKVKDEKFMRVKSIKESLAKLMSGEKDQKKLKLYEAILKNLRSLL